MRRIVSNGSRSWGSAPRAPGLGLAPATTEDPVPKTENRRPRRPRYTARMGQFLDSVPFSGIIRIRDMMYTVKDPFRLDQGGVSFDAPDTVKTAMHRAIDENRSHYLQTTGLPRLLELLTEKLRRQNGIPIGSPE